MAKTKAHPNDVFDQLVRARDEQQVLVARETERLESLNQALFQFQARTDGGPLPASMEFSNMGITAATTKLLEENPGGLDTATIAAELKKRGLFSKSKNLTAAVFATLHNSSADNSKSANPRFKRRNDLWFLWKGGRRA